ncbi:hypothetical protein T09_6225 [Trichinella sp. T9]|nr:hypothetical protein T09_6225 [Trichinella sp. T9]
MKNFFCCGTHFSFCQIFFIKERPSQLKNDDPSVKANDLWLIQFHRVTLLPIYLIVKLRHAKPYIALYG